ASASTCAPPPAVCPPSCVIDHRADHLTRLHRAERLVHVVELDPPADHALEIELALLPEPQQAREVDAHVGAAVHRALERLLAGEHVERADLDLLLQAPDAHHHRGAAAADHVVGGADRLRIADALERVIETLAAGDLELRALELV